VPDGRERLTPRARRVLSLAEDEARALRQAEVGTEHVLLGLLREGRGLAARALRDLGVEPAQLGQRVRSRLPLAEVGPSGAVTLSPGARSALDAARAEAVRLHHDYVGTEHLLLGLLRDGEGPAFVTLVGIGITLEGARRQIIAILNESAPEPTSGLPGGLASVQSRRGVIDRLADRDPDLMDAGHCARCGRPRRSDWRYCVFCGESWPRCDRCDTPLPAMTGVRFCPGCGVMVDGDERA
jgi:ATP-dependent Clp protease ATP-binding subunit ClpA